MQLWINPAPDGSVLPLIRIASQGAANAWTDEFGDNDGYVGYSFGFDGYDSVDGYKATSDGYGFFDSKWARQYADLREQLGITTGSPEPNHYILNESTGQIVLDQPLRQFDTLLVTYVAEADLNSVETFNKRKYNFTCCTDGL
jgi:hypothetical protein